MGGKAGTPDPDVLGEGDWVLDAALVVGLGVTVAGGCCGVHPVTPRAPITARAAAKPPRAGVLSFR
ncbi:MAG: hypothetical protein JOZ47_20440 [Kutzneria sp.]|nr:hypothetical protein [Kutzneria sp.]MBV9847416.1 hypothetical protein [Kutzneria sp.]